MMKGLLLIGGLLASAVSGHIQMSNPYPIRSPLNKAASGQKDYSYTNPLSTDGSDYPCKGYVKDPFNSVATYSPGGSYKLELEGSATHGGGSCQIALSYDNGATFKVIHSMLGGCPITKSYQFTIPSDAQTGEALLAWSWFNKVGNREMYMNCAQVTIGGGARKGTRDLDRRDAFSSLPELFRANTGGPAQCKTIEGEEVNFPLPGPSVEGSLSGKGYQCTGSAPFLGGGRAANVDTSPSSSSSSSDSSMTQGANFAETMNMNDYQESSTSTVASNAMVPSSSAVAAASSAAPSVHAVQSSAVASPSVHKVASTFATTPKAKSTETTAAEPAREQSPQTPDTTAEGSCTNGGIVCGTDGKSWSLCSNGRVVNMGSVAPGTQCRHGAMQPAS
ncbi:putative extracellular protein [Aspergillus affinis]|uniref:putative extracellular protein n=1 Tax=Aspergillus affinis TaxID=1070780 RepID=UPI0022FE9BB1|nr:uncharacterized protein KD926_002304 [Aspergillus affinis]KAI9043925.1 hypothetical protein KD926_002304 [Aspergillus affinis]